MKKRLVLLMTLAAVAASAQATAPNSAAQAPTPNAPGRGAGRGMGMGGGLMGPSFRSPEVSDDRRVTFRLSAPNAKEVVVRGVGRQPLTMQKDSSGIWTATTDPLNPDIYAYTFVVDGVTVPDPLNTMLRPSYHSLGQSAFLVPGDNVWTHLPNSPWGAVARHVFHSAVADDDRDFYVYTPPNYDPKRKQPYPVLYLLHGLGDEANAWTQVGAANTILDTLITQGKAVPMIMVNPLGYGTAKGPRDLDADPEMLFKFIRILTEEVMPQVEKHYNASTKATDHAVAGLSMGGGESILGGLNHLDKFAWIGSFSGAFNNWWLTRPTVNSPAEAATGRGAGPGNMASSLPGRIGGRGALVLVESQIPKLFPTLDAKSNAKIKLIWIACGTADGLIGVNRQFKAYLDSKGVKASFTEIPDMGHVWPLWRQNLIAFAPLLFK